MVELEQSIRMNFKCRQCLHELQSAPGSSYNCETRTVYDCAMTYFICCALITINKLKRHVKMLVQRKYPSIHHGLLLSMCKEKVYALLVKYVWLMSRYLSNLCLSKAEIIHEYNRVMLHNYYLAGCLHWVVRGHGRLILLKDTAESRYGKPEAMGKVSLSLRHLTVNLIYHCTHLSYTTP